MNNGGVIGRIFGTGRNAQRQRQQSRESGYIAYENEEIGARVRMVPDTNANAVAARHNMAQIYGEDALGGEFGMRGVIEVMDPETGQYTPVVGNRRGVQDMDTQIAALQSWQETGQIGNFSSNEGTNAVQTASAPSAAPTNAGGGAAGNGVVVPAATPQAPSSSTRPQSREDGLMSALPALMMQPSEFTPMPGSALAAMVDPSGPTNARAQALGLNDAQSGQPQQQIVQLVSPMQVDQTSGVSRPLPDDLLVGANSPLAQIGPRRTTPQLQQPQMMPFIISGY